MNARNLIDDLKRMGVVLSANGDRLHVNAPKGVITDHLKEQLFRSKPELLKVLSPTLVHSNPGNSLTGSTMQIYKITVRGKGITVLDSSGRSEVEMMEYLRRKFGSALDSAV
ncbi:MAG: hypothetical protein V3T17_06245 [Pseudomonadales bacterium]